MRRYRQHAFRDHQEIIQELVYWGYTQRQIAQILNISYDNLRFFTSSKDIKHKQSHKTLAELIKSANLPLPDKKKYRK